jgi:hypothetical protein
VSKCLEEKDRQAAGKDAVRRRFAHLGFHKRRKNVVVFDQNSNRKGDCYNGLICNMV